VFDKPLNVSKKKYCGVTTFFVATIVVVWTISTCFSQKVALLRFHRHIWEKE
jgi:hypothetical protein